jgi:hypothetical protein
VKPEKLPSVTTKGDGKAEIQAPTDDADLNSQYEAELRAFSTKWVEPMKAPSAEDKQEDYYKGFRSIVVLFWMFCNLVLCAVVLQSGGLEITTDEDEQAKKKTENAAIYLNVVLWSVAGLSAFRFIGAMWFLVVRMVGPIPVLTSVTALLTFSSSVVCSLMRRILFTSSGVVRCWVVCVELCMACRFGFGGATAEVGLRVGDWKAFTIWLLRFIDGVGGPFRYHMLTTKWIHLHVYFGSLHSLLRLSWCSGLCV